MVKAWLGQGVDKGPNVITWKCTYLGCNAHLVCFDFRTQFLFFIFFPMETNQIIDVYNDFVGVIHGFHYLKYDLILKCLLMCFQN